MSLGLGEKIYSAFIERYKKDQKHTATNITVSKTFESYFQS